MRDRDFIFDCVNLLHYKYHKINLKLGGPEIDSLDWKRTKKTINSINDDDRYI